MAAGVNVLEETNLLSFMLVNIIFLIGTFTFAVVLGVVSDDITTEVKVRALSLASDISQRMRHAVWLS